MVINFQSVPYGLSVSLTIKFSLHPLIIIILKLMIKRRYNDWSRFTPSCNTSGLCPDQEYQGGRPDFWLLSLSLCARVHACVRVYVSLCIVQHHENMPIWFWPPKTPLLYNKTGVYRGIHYFLFLLKNIDCGYPLEPPRRGGSNEYPQSMFWAEIWKISEFFLYENFRFLAVKFSVYLNRRVFVMETSCSLTRICACLYILLIRILRIIHVHVIIIIIIIIIMTIVVLVYMDDWKTLSMFSILSKTFSWWQFEI